MKELQPEYQRIAKLSESSKRVKLINKFKHKTFINGIDQCKERTDARTNQRDSTLQQKYDEFDEEQ